jgi:drug/metabolite transporter (DMT)-like permease
MVTLADSKYGGSESSKAQSVLGDMLCLLSAVVYGAYTVSLRWVGGVGLRLDGHPLPSPPLHLCSG